MKTTAAMHALSQLRWCSVLCLFTMMLAACKPAPSADPERAFTLYDIAWRCGQRDRLTPNPRDWHRYADKLAAFTEVPDREAVFAGGYEDGFDQHPDEPMSDPVLDYDREFRRGRSEAWQGKSSSGSSPGYLDGFGNSKHAFGRPY